MTWSRAHQANRDKGGTSEIPQPDPAIAHMNFEQTYDYFQGGSSSSAGGFEYDYDQGFHYLLVVLSINR